MSFIRTVGEGFAWTTAGMIAGKVVAFANIALILSQLTVYEYGVTELVFSVVSTVGLFLLPGLAATVTTDLGVELARRSYGTMKALFLEFLSLNIVLGIFAWAALFFGSTFVAALSGNILIGEFFKIVAFSFLISPFRVATTMLATVMVRYADQSFFGVVEEIAKGALLAVFFFWFGRGADGLLWATVLAPLVATLVFAPRTISAFRVFSGAHAAAVEPMWNALREHRKWSVASTYVNTIGKNMRTWIIKLMLGTEAVGLYAFAAGIYAHASSLTNLQSALTPVVPRYVDRPELLSRIFAAGMKYQIAFSFAAMAAGIMLVPFFTHVAFPQYEAALTLALVMLLAVVPNGLAANLTPVFAALREQRTLFFSMVLRILSTLIFLPVCIALWGLVGAGIELIATMLLTCAERFFRISRLLPRVSLRPSSFRVTDPEERRIVKDVLNRSGMRPILAPLFRRWSDMV